jgi:hypothetical protein
MRNILAIVFTGLLGITTALAQSGIGIKGGVNLTNISTDAGSLNNNIKESLNTRTGYVFGVWGRIGDKFYLQPEVLVASKGGKLEVTPADGGSPEMIDVKYTNLDIPLLIGVKPVKFLRIMAGPVASLKLSEDMKLREALSEYASNSGDALAKSTWGYQFGIGLKLGGLDLDLRREGSLSDINVVQFQNEEKFSQRASGWVLTLGIKIL